MRILLDYATEQGDFVIVPILLESTAIKRTIYR